MPGKLRLLLFAVMIPLALIFADDGGSVAPAEAKHIASHQCGVTSGSYARICRPGAHTSCLGAVKRGVKGFTLKLCEKRKAACSTCLANIHTCISRIGHWPKVTHTCGKCKARFDGCIKRRYPQKP